MNLPLQGEGVQDHKKWGAGPKVQECCICRRGLGLPTSSRSAGSAESNYSIWVVNAKVNIEKTCKQKLKDLTNHHNHPKGDPFSGCRDSMGFNCHAYHAGTHYQCGPQCQWHILRSTSWASPERSPRVAVPASGTQATLALPCFPWPNFALEWELWSRKP